jgi:type VI secretion system secreted protein Hcp
MPWYVKFDGVDGSATQRDHIHWTNAVTVNIGGHKAGGGGTGVGRVGGKMHLEDISIGIINDRGVPKLLEAAVKGKIFKKVEIHGTATYGDAGEQVYLKIELENVQITSYQLGVLDNNSATDDLALSLNFEKYKTVFTEYGKDGAKGGNVEFEWKVEPAEK